jgi:hypothetical protein
MEACGEKPNVQLRLRRDIQGFLTAIKTSAILHKANREMDESGRIVATIDDYRYAHEAFDEGLARLYKIKTPETALAVVRAVESVGATPTFGVKVTVSALMAKLGITGRGAASDRLRDATDRGFLKLVEPAGGYGRTSARLYEIAKSSEEIARDTAERATPCVFPSPDEVENEIAKGGEHPEVQWYRRYSWARRPKLYRLYHCTGGYTPLCQKQFRDRQKRLSQSLCRF